MRSRSTPASCWPTPSCTSTGSAASIPPTPRKSWSSLIADIKPTIPVYCRVNRVIRDIPSTNVVAGNKRTSLRMDVFDELARRGQKCSLHPLPRGARGAVDPAALRLVDTVYPAAAAPRSTSSSSSPRTITSPGICACRCPATDSPDLTERPARPVDAGAALIREVHVYGQSLAVGEEQPGAAQHVGLGTRLIAEASRIAREHGFPRLAVIAAVGTRLYYEKRGFERGINYLVKDLSRKP